MAEARAAFQFSVSPEGRLHLNVDRDLLKLVWHTGIHDSWKRIEKMKNQVYNGVYPASSWSWILTLVILCSLEMVDVDLTFGLLGRCTRLPGIVSLGPPFSELFGLLICATVIWLAGAFAIRLLLRFMLGRQFWMFQPVGKPSFSTWLLFKCIRFLCMSKANLFSYQYSLPRMPVPPIKDTVNKYLLSMKPLLSKEGYADLERKADEFLQTIGSRLQNYLVLKSWWATNYITDWWEEFVYLRNRNPIMINSNYYAVGLMKQLRLDQAPRAATMIHCLFTFKSLIDEWKIPPVT